MSQAHPAVHAAHNRRLTIPRVVASLLLLGLAACTSTRIGLDDIRPSQAYRAQTDSALTGKSLSIDTRTTLRRRGLMSLHAQDPAACIQALREVIIREDRGSDELFALAELSLAYAIELVRERHQPQRPAIATKPSFSQNQTGPLGLQWSDIGRVARGHFMASAIYAYAFLFPGAEEDPVPALDPRTRLAADIYARALARGFAINDSGEMRLAGGHIALPFGRLGVSFDQSELSWGRRVVEEVRWVGASRIHGLNNHYREAGIGTPVAARTDQLDSNFDFVARNATVPATVLLRMPDPRSQVRTSQIQGALELYTANEDRSVEIDGRVYPLEFDPSATLAASLERSRFWESELTRFLGRAIGIDQQVRLAALEPYVTGKIPVVFVHGTDSSAATWADMFNDLQRDQEIRDRYHFWFFSYDSGNSILYSKMLLRRALNEAVTKFREAGGGQCLDRMMVVGHSQGGLLTKLTAVTSGTAFWDAYFSKPVDEIPISDRMRATLKEMAFFDALPYVRRVVFLSTPHRGSFLAGPQFVRRLAGRLIQVPRELTALSAERAGLVRYTRPSTRLGRAVTAIDNMSPNDPFIRTSSELPMAAGVHAHSIIALRPGESKGTGSDGVVRYSSAHIDGVESELVVPSGHSVHRTSPAIEEVRRIMLLHAEQYPCSVARQREISYPGAPLTDPSETPPETSE